ncbi:PepSY domain-containing protein [Porphyromonas macacae]|nr:PepSY domain-containing protein [Porphyromonas macacae]
MKKTGMRKIISYDSTGRISDAYFKYSEAHIGPRYDFDEHGNITDSIDTDTGYTICWAQAMAIGKAHAGHKMHKTEPNWVLGKEEQNGRHYWNFFYDDKQRKIKRLLIDAETGKVVKEYKVEIII